MQYSIIPILLVFVLTIIFLHFINLKRYKKTSYYQNTQNPYLSTIFNVGTNGEYSLYRHLREFELQGCRFLFNLYLPLENNKTSEIDMIMFHPMGLFVIESKNYTGWIFGNERNKQWTQRFPTGDKYHFYNPIMQNATHIRAIRRLINNTVPIYSVIAFSDDCTLKDVTIKSNVMVTYYGSICTNIKSKIAELSNNPIKTELSEETYNKLYPYSQASNDTKLQHIEHTKNKF